MFDISVSGIHYENLIRGKGRSTQKEIRLCERNKGPTRFVVNEVDTALLASRHNVLSQISFSLQASTLGGVAYWRRLSACSQFYLPHIGGCRGGDSISSTTNIASDGFFDSLLLFT